MCAGPAFPEAGVASRDSHSLSVSTSARRQSLRGRKRSLSGPRVSWVWSTFLLCTQSVCRNERFWGRRLQNKEESGLPGPTSVTQNSQSCPQQVPARPGFQTPSPDCGGSRLCGGPTCLPGTPAQQQTPSMGSFERVFFKNMQTATKVKHTVDFSCLCPDVASSGQRKDLLFYSLDLAPGPRSLMTLPPQRHRGLCQQEVTVNPGAGAGGWQPPPNLVPGLRTGRFSLGPPGSPGVTLGDGPVETLP